jgi:hypothetical protein
LKATTKQKITGSKMNHSDFIRSLWKTVKPPGIAGMATHFAWG